MRAGVCILYRCGRTAPPCRRASLQILIFYGMASRQKILFPTFVTKLRRSFYYEHYNFLRL